MIGFFELGLIVVLSLVVLGPQRMMVAARYCGLYWRKFRILYTRTMDELDQQLRLDEMTRHSARTTEKKHKKQDTDS